MKKEERPKLIEYRMIDIIVTILSISGLFRFWDILSDIEKLFYIVIPSIIIVVIINIIRYYLKVKHFYDKYDELYNKYYALAQNYNVNVCELKQEQYNNEVLREFSNRSVNLLMLYNDLKKEERNNIKNQLIEDFINGIKKEEKIDEKKI